MTLRQLEDLYDWIENKRPFKEGTNMPRLVLSRNAGEALVIGDNVRVTILTAARGRARVLVEAPREVLVLREELTDDRWTLTDPSGPSATALIAE